MHKDINSTFVDLQADSLLQLAKEHKKNCSPPCQVSLFTLFLLYRQLKGEGALQDAEHFLS
jgi:hypothetical protein